MKFIHNPAATLWLTLLLVVSACSQQNPEPSKEVAAPSAALETQTAEFALALPEKHAADAVAQVLREGGNAVDAAVTAAFTLAVTFPTAGNIGGGGFLLTRMNKELHFLDYREKAPAGANRDMYQEADGSVNPRSSLVGARSAGVPGTVAGMWQAHQKFGTKPWAELLAPAVKLAEEGFAVHRQTAEEIPEIIEWFNGEVNFAEYFGDLQNGGVFKQPELAETLRRIANQGADDFYRGETAKLLVAQMQRDNGLISAEDLNNYQAVWRAPLIGKWRDYTVASAPPPSSGGFAVLQLLQMKEILRDQFAGLAHNSSAYVHLVAEMEKRVFADRAEYFGDPDFVSIPMSEIMSEYYIAARAAEVNPLAISATESVVPGVESNDTTHFSIVDQWGNAVSNTYTINWNYGNGVVVEGAGFLLNNEMDDFSTKPGVPNVYGVVGGTANEIQPAKRMLSSMSPTIVLKDDKVDIVVGAMGGSTIFTTVFQVIANLVDFNMSSEQAVAVGRFHHQLLPKDLITTSVDKPLATDTTEELVALGYTVEPHSFAFGNVQLVAIKDGKLTAASDPRFIGKSIVESVPASDTDQ